MNETNNNNWKLKLNFQLLTEFIMLNIFVPHCNTLIILGELLNIFQLQQIKHDKSVANLHYKGYRHKS